MIKVPNNFWLTHIRYTEFDFYDTAREDIEDFLKVTIHKSAQVKVVGKSYTVKFKHPKYETLFLLKYLDDVR